MLDRIVEKYSFHNLLIWSLLYMMVSPFLERVPKANIIITVFVSLVLFFGVYTIQKQSELFKLTLGVLGITLVLIWLEVLKIVSLPSIANTLVLFIYMAMLVYSFGKYVFTARTVNSSLICAALCLYIFLGVLWGLVYEAIHILNPGSFAGYMVTNSTSPIELRQHFQYFSFVTLTTLGYGDIVPKTSGAAALCYSEAIMGQFFMAVLVARLVGIQVAQQFGARCEDEDR